MDLSNPYSQSIEFLLKTLNTSESGLTQEEAEKRLSQFGLNQLKPPKKTSLISLYLKQFKNSLTLILLVATLLVLFIYFFGKKDPSDLVEAGLILAIVFLTTILGFAQEFKAEKTIESLKKLLAYKTKVLRNAIPQEIEVKNLVPGDIVVLEEGTRVPADIRIIKAFSLTLNEASLTGESNPVTKTSETLKADLQIADQENMIFSGTSITSGRGIGVVVKTGIKTEIGRIAQEVSETKEEETPIQRRLNQIGSNIAFIIVSVCGSVFIFIIFFAKEFATLPALERIIHSFIASVALAVAAIPEGLPAVVTISLALGTQRMLKKNALIRKLNSVETLGSIDVICSDKTGTLTKGIMTVKEIYFDNKHYKVGGVGYETNGSFSHNGKEVDPQELEMLLSIGLFCNNSSLSQDKKAIGDPTEVALIVAAKKANIKTQFKRIHEIPFNSQRKMMSVVVENNSSYFVFTKGAPEIVLKHCNISELDKKEISKVNENMSKNALRNLGFAYKAITKNEYLKIKDNEKLMEENLRYVGIMGMIDPPREEIPVLIEKLKQSGITTVMITGDHIETAKSIAQQIGIKGESITGEQLDKLSRDEILKRCENINIYARINPDSKMKIVEALKKNGHIVAMTGDGVNDAPALKKADIGISMGITGTDVAKEASDMVLLDDNFSTIVASVEEGRGIFHNIRKFVSYLLACNIGEVLIVFIALIIFQKLPLTAIMLLWINVVTDGLPAVALGLDKPERQIMRHPPSIFQGQIVTTRIWAEMFIFGILMAIAVLGIFTLNLNNGLLKAQGAAFSSIVIFEVVKLFLIRSTYKTSFFSNPYLLISIALTIAIQLAIIYIPLFNKLFEIESIGFFDWAYIIIASIIMWFVFKFFKSHLLLT